MRRSFIFLLAGLAACAGPVPAPPVEEERAPAVSREMPAEVAVPPVGVSGMAVREEIPVIREGDAVFFATGSASLRPGADDEVLRTHAERLRDDPTLMVTLIGHTDHHGSRSMNLALAERRTAAVAARLRELGVPPRQLRQRSYGHEKARGGCRSESCRSRLRRVDLVYPQAPAAASRPAAQKGGRGK